MAQDTLVRPRTKADFDAFLATEPEDGRYEFVDGQIVKMTGGTGGHSAIGSRIVSLVDQQIDFTRFVVHGPDRGIEMANVVRYPDGVVEAVPFDAKSRWTDCPSLIVEVLSPDSGKRDKVTKAAEYTEIATLDTYIVAEPDKPHCYVWQRDETGNFPSQPVQISGAAGVILVPALGLTLRLADIYRHLFRTASP
jgi:Uma2 family endonuclease